MLAKWHPTSRKKEVDMITYHYRSHFLDVWDWDAMPLPLASYRVEQQIASFKVSWSTWFWRVREMFFCFWKNLSNALISTTSGSCGHVVRNRPVQTRLQEAVGTKLFLVILPGHIGDGKSTLRICVTKTSLKQWFVAKIPEVPLGQYSCVWVQEGDWECSYLSQIQNRWLRYDGNMEIQWKYIMKYIKTLSIK